MTLSSKLKQQLGQNQKHMDKYRFSYDKIRELTLSEAFLNLKPGETLETPQLGNGLYINYTNRLHINSHFDKDFVEISLTGSRMDTFTRSNQCVCCGIVGTTFIPTISYGSKNNWTAHLNLYTKGGLMLTMDHILPKSLGGKTEATNLVTCCKHCNEFKGSVKLSWKNIRNIVLATKGNYNNLPTEGFSPYLLKTVYNQVKSVNI